MCDGLERFLQTNYSRWNCYTIAITKACLKGEEEEEDDEANSISKHQVDNMCEFTIQFFKSSAFSSPSVLVSFPVLVEDIHPRENSGIIASFL